jgi:Uma2 family endonuclease
MPTSASHPVSTWRPPPQGEWTYADYLHQPDNGYRYEVLAGDLHMSPAPSSRHQWAVSVILLAIGGFLKQEGLGRVFTSPFDVKLSEETLVQPDVVVVLNDRAQIIVEHGIEGSPDLLVEVLSPSTEVTDRRKKFDIYLRHGIREYWIVDLSAKTVEVYVLRTDNYALLAKFERGQMLTSEVLPGFALDTTEVFTL